MLMISIRRATGGYIITDDAGEEMVAITLEDVVKGLLLHFQGLIVRDLPLYFQDRADTLRNESLTQQTPPNPLDNM